MKAQKHTVIISVIAALMIGAGCVHHGHVHDEPTGSVQWPTTVSEAADRIIADMSEADKETIRNTPYEDLIKFHHGWGTGIRNDFGLWQGNTRLMEDTHTKHPDDASMVIIKAVWEELQKN